MILNIKIMQGTDINSGKFSNRSKICKMFKKHDISGDTNMT